jgi:hypothetical protein
MNCAERGDWLTYGVGVERDPGYKYKRKMRDRKVWPRVSEPLTM